MPKIDIALGIAGQAYSHAPHPIHMSGLMFGISWSGIAGFGTIVIAPAGQFLEHAPHWKPSVTTIHEEGS